MRVREAASAAVHRRPGWGPSGVCRGRAALQVCPARRVGRVLEGPPDRVRSPPREIGGFSMIYAVPMISLLASALFYIEARHDNTALMAAGEALWGGIFIFLTFAVWTWVPRWLFW